jgi:two-component system nitrogen regulation response regulator GlnG
MPKLLVIDDEANIRFSIEAVFEGPDLRVLGAATAEEGLQVAADESPEVILLDIVLGSTSGLDLFHELRRIDPKVMIVFITGCGTAETAIEAMKLGAYDYLLKPLDAAQLEQVVRQAIQISRLMHVPALLDVGERPEDKPDRLVGSSAKMQAVCKQTGRVAAQDINVLILGESGTGKELVARAIYHHSRRHQAPFLAINCAAIPEALLESELFGHERGSFTGADRKRIGKFEQCHTGTLFLDEIGDMASPTQAKILRLLQEGRFERVGGNECVTSDVRIIAATNQDLDRLIEEGRFRKDLYYRLRGVTLQMPALRDRREDIPELAHYFLFRYNRQLGTSVQSISAEAMELLERYDWPGNVRELQSVIREALVASAGPTILPEFLPAELHKDGSAETDGEAVAASDLDWLGLGQFVDHAVAAGETDVYRRAKDHFDRLVLSRAFQETGGNQYRASEILGLSRVTLRSKLRSMGTSGTSAPECPAEAENQGDGSQRNDHRPHGGAEGA